MMSTLKKPFHSPPSEKSFISITVRRPSNYITFQTTIRGAGNTTLTAATRYAINPVPNMPHSQKKNHYLQIPISPSHEERYFEGIGFQKTILGIFIRLKCLVCLLQVFRSNGTVESENNQVFLNFRGEIRAGFISCLYKELTREGYSTFIDKKMNRGVNIDEELMKAIRNAELSVVVISPSYASSKSCLDELVEILSQRHFGHKALPVFYLLDPDDVHNLTANFGAAFDGLVKSLENTADNKIRVNRWKEALKEVARISGLVLREHQCESEFIDKIVAEVKQLLSLPPQRASSFVLVACVLFYTLIQLMDSYCTNY